MRCELLLKRTVLWASTITQWGLSWWLTDVKVWFGRRFCRFPDKRATPKYAVRAEPQSSFFCPRLIIPRQKYLFSDSFHWPKWPPSCRIPRTCCPSKNVSVGECAHLPNWDGKAITNKAQRPSGQRARLCQKDKRRAKISPRHLDQTPTHLVGAKKMRHKPTDGRAV